MEPIDSKCYHLGAGISTATVGTQSSGIGSAIVNTGNNGNNNNNNNNNCNGNGATNNNNGANGSGSGNANTTNDELTLSTKSKAQLNSGNYLNIVPMPMGVQYHHRRKYSPQIQSDYQ